VKPELYRFCTEAAIVALVAYLLVARAAA